MNWTTRYKTADPWDIKKYVVSPKDSPEKPENVTSEGIPTDKVYMEST